MGQLQTTSKGYNSCDSGAGFSTAPGQAMTPLLSNISPKDVIESGADWKVHRKESLLWGLEGAHLEAAAEQRVEGTKLDSISVIAAPLL